MTLDELETIFEEQEDEYLHFERVAMPPTRRPDLCAFMLLDRLISGSRDILAGAKHDEVCLAIDPLDLASAASKEDLITLIRCGIRYSDDSFRMFV